MHIDKLYFRVVFVTLGLLRYTQITFVKGGSGSPTEILLKERYVHLVLLVL